MFVEDKQKTFQEDSIIDFQLKIILIFFKL